MFNCVLPSNKRITTISSYQGQSCSIPAVRAGCVVWKNNLWKQMWPFCHRGVQSFRYPVSANPAGNRDERSDSTAGRCFPSPDVSSRCRHPAFLVPPIVQRSPLTPKHTLCEPASAFSRLSPSTIPCPSVSRVMNTSISFSAGFYLTVF